MGEKGFSQSGWRETDHQLNLQRNPTSSVLKPRRNGGMWCFRMLRPGDSFDTRWEKQAARLGFFTDFCWHLHIDFAGENCRNGISKLESLFYGITFKPLTYFLNILECPIMTWKTHLWPPDLWSSHLSRPRFCGASTSCSPNGPSKCCP